MSSNFFINQRKHDLTLIMHFIGHRKRSKAKVCQLALKNVSCLCLSFFVFPLSLLANPTVSPKTVDIENFSFSSKVLPDQLGYKLSFAEALKQAYQHNHDLQLTVLAVRSAEATTASANTSPNPLLTVQTANINPAQGVGSGSWRGKTVDSTLRLDQLIERGGKRRYRLQNALELENAARDDQLDAMRQLRISVSESYYELLAAQEKLQIQQEMVQLFERSLEAARKRKKAGDIAGVDIARFEVDALRAQNDAREAVSELQKAKRTLALLIGASSVQNIEASDNWPALSVFSALSGLQENSIEKKFNAENERSLVPAYLETLVQQRADVRAAQKRVTAALAAQQGAMALHTRDITVGVQFEHYPSSPVNNQGSGNSYGLSAQIPLFINAHYQGEILSANAALASAQETLEKTKAEARIDIQNTWETLHAASDQVNRFDQSLLKAASKSVKAAEFAFKNGAMGVIDLLDAQRTYRNTQLDAITARTRYSQSLEAWHAETVTP
ncbi:MAG: TolC family protein [Pseudomonadota bacterium]